MKTSTPKTRIVYKVVENTDSPGVFQSWSPPLDSLILKYRLNKVTRPKLKGSKIFVFDSLEAAKEITHAGSDSILKCEATGVSRPIRKRPDACCQMPTIKQFWKTGTCKYLDPAHTGTRFCDSVKPIERVQ